MSNNREQRNFSLGIDTDSEVRLVEDGSYLYALNLRSGVSDNGVQVNFKGNTLVPYSLPAGDNKCIGTLRDIKRNAIIYFVYNSLGNHSILHYFCATNTIETILAPFTSGAVVFTTDFLGFTEFNKIHSSNIVDDILLWTDNTVPPRKINIKRAKDFMNQLTPAAGIDPYSNLIASGSLEERTQFINAIKYAPVDKPTHVLGYDSARKTNFIRGFMIQVRYRWLYDDNEPSAWSTGSYISLPMGEENITGNFAVTNANNYLEVTIGTGHPTVRKIEVAFRFGNLEPWSKIDTPIEKYDKDNQVVIASLTDYSFRFYNDVVLVPIGVEENIKNFDAVPQLSKTQDINENRLFYSNNLEGYDNPALDVSIQSSMVTEDFGEDSLYAGAAVYSDTLFSISSLSNYPLFYQVIMVPANISLIKVGTVISFDLAVSFGSTTDYPITYTITQDDVLGGPLAIQESIYQLLLDMEILIFGTLTKVTLTSGSITMYGIQTQLNVVATPMTTSITNFVAIPPTIKMMSHKKGSNQKYAIVYFDEANRDGGAVTNSSLSHYLQYLPEFAANIAVSETATVIAKLLVTIRHLPPLWAKRWQLVRAENNLRKYVQFLTKSPDIDTDPNGNFVIDMEFLTDYITKERIITTVQYEFEEGDKIRFVDNTHFYVSGYIETTVLSFDPSTSKLVVQPFDKGVLINNITQPTTEGILGELFAYKPTTDNVPYFEIGEVYDVLNPGTSQRAHAGNVQDQIVGVRDAVVLLDRGDCYIYRRYFSNNTIPTFVESEYFSDYILLSNNTDISRVQVVRNETQKRYEQQIRYGGRYFPGTQTNLLLSFGASDYDNMETTFGPVNRIISVGEVLKVLQTKKLTSVYISRNMIYSANGEKQITLSDKVLGTKYPSETDYGCAHPESVFKDDRQVFWYDVNTGSFIQDSANGPYPISNYKAATYFRDKSREIQNKSNVFVYANIDNLNNIINVAFSDESGLSITTSETIQYNTAKNRWNSFTSFIPDYMAQSAMVFISMKAGALWVHNTNELRNNFYGVQYNSVIRLVANVNPYEVKVFDSLAVDSNEIWEAPSQGDISIQPNAQFPNGMESRLIAAKFRNKEGVWYADILRDMNTPNQASAQIALLSGRKMRGHEIVIELQNSSTGEVKLLGAIVYSTLSQIS